MADDLDNHLLGEEIQASRVRSLDGLVRPARREPELATRLGAGAVTESGRYPAAVFQ
jgi:hypothetical protein